MKSDKPQVRDGDRVELESDYAVCAWARHFNVSERRVREAVAAVGDKALRVREHLHGASPSRRGATSERPA
jgi:hypothetical protein